MADVQSLGGHLQRFRSIPFGTSSVHAGEAERRFRGRERKKTTCWSVGGAGRTFHVRTATTSLALRLQPPAAARKNDGASGQEPQHVARNTTATFFFVSPSPTQTLLLDSAPFDGPIFNIVFQWISFSDTIGYAVY